MDNQLDAIIATAYHALQTTLVRFMPLKQRVVLLNQLRGEEGEGIAELVNRVAATILAMPKIYETDGQGNDAIAHLHYFAGSVDAWVTEKDMGDGSGNTRQHQAFGLITLTGSKDDAKLGYISIEELIRNDVELDLYWTPKKLREI